MIKLKGKSLKEILDGVKVNPLSRKDLVNVEDHGVKLSFYGDSQERAMIFHDNNEYWFVQNIRDKLYYYMMGIKRRDSYE